MPEMKLADWCNKVERSVLRQLIGVVSQPGILSFAGGLPAPELFPTSGLATAFQTVFNNDPLALQYRPPFVPLKKHIVNLMAKRFVSKSPLHDQLQITKTP
jgi:2-aminoadipate transaminase